MALESLVIQGPNQLKGDVQISGAKNAALPMMVLTLLTDQPCYLSHVPRLKDIESMASILSSIGTQISIKDETHVLDTKSVEKTHAPYDEVRKMRASVMVLGPMLARTGRARVALPGGCAIGVRPIDLHLKAFEKMGATIEIQDGDVIATLPKVKACKVLFDRVTVTGTMNALMAASRGNEPVKLMNCATEPEVTQVAQTLQTMGATIEGVGTDTMTICGRNDLQGFSTRVIPDRIEAGTYMVAAAITKGDVRLSGVEPSHVDSLTSKLEQMGVSIQKEGQDILRVSMNDELLPVDIQTAPYPGFATDMQAQFVALLTQANGKSTVTETIFENRFMHVAELVRMGADIRIKNSMLSISGKTKLSGAPVMATDLRASASLVLAGLVAEGQTTVNRIYHLDRGYERMEEKLIPLGATISRVTSS
ncbi:MAG: UDP-N-acetylglucosamine 1-carboxyvinyltransferase [Bdellovibrionales bacterium]|nr:UDP-N-acetylglucosamine 1-carboxyvinyltransferase [Bdellovibrionales bacterium]